MAQVKLRELGRQNAGITLPWSVLERDGLVTGENIPDDQTMGIDRLGEGVYLVRAADDGDLPEVRETDVVKDAVARELMDRSAFDRIQPSNAD